MNSAKGAANMAQEKKREKRENPLGFPKESKVRNKRTSDGDGVSCDTALSPRAGVRGGAREKRRRTVSAKMLAWLEQLNAEGFEDPVKPTVEEAVRVTGGSDDDRLQWMKICNRGLNPTFHVREQNPSGCWGFAHRSSLHSRFGRIGSFA